MSPETGWKYATSHVGVAQKRKPSGECNRRRAAGWTNDSIVVTETFRPP